MLAGTMGWLSDVYGRMIVAPTDWWKILPRKIYSDLQRLKSNQSWFEVYKIEPNVYVFYEPGQFEEVISYLVLGKKKAALIDTGLGIGNVKKLAEEFTRLPVIIVNTHSHYDHVAQNHMFSEVAIFDTPNARQAAKNGYGNVEMSHLLAKGMLWKPLPEDFDAENHRVPPFTVTWWLKNGDIIDLGDRKLEVIHTPGHSPDSICLLDRNAKLLWTGDTFYTGAIYIHLPGSDLDTFISSYEKVIAVSPLYEKLMPSHNEPWVDKAVLEEVLQATKEIKAGDQDYIEGVDEATRIRRYVYPRFSIITKAHPATI
jgi:glyoxylase-like metal-dependent hydrolase (beta-lactamase superfamily II)